MLPYNETLYFWSPEQSFKSVETTAFGYKEDDVSQSSETQMLTLNLLEYDWL